VPPSGWLRDQAKNPLLRSPGDGGADVNPAPQIGQNSIQRIRDRGWLREVGRLRIMSLN
jgi:hypothetical protein